MIRSICVVVALASLSAPALAGPPTLAVHIDRVPVAPRAVVVARSAGKSALERHRSAAAPARLRAGQDAVLVVEVREIGSQDVVAVSRAERHGRRVVVSLVVRRFTGALAANVVGDAYVEVDLGRLRRGFHQVIVTETSTSFDEPGHPEKVAGKPRVSSTSIDLSIR